MCIWPRCCDELDWWYRTLLTAGDDTFSGSKFSNKGATLLDLERVEGVQQMAGFNVHPLFDQVVTSFVKGAAPGNGTRGFSRSTGEVLWEEDEEDLVIGSLTDAVSQVYAAACVEDGTWFTIRSENHDATDIAYTYQFVKRDDEGAEMERNAHEYYNGDKTLTTVTPENNVAIKNIAADRDGNIYGVHARLRAIDLTTELEPARLYGLGNSPNMASPDWSVDVPDVGYLDVAPDGTCFVTGSFISPTATVAAFNSAGVEQWRYNGLGGPLCTTEAGELFGVGSGNTVKKLDAAGSLVWTSTGLGSTIFGVLAKRDGTGCIAVTSGGSVVRISNDGSVRSTDTGAAGYSFLGTIPMTPHVGRVGAFAV